MWSVITFNVQIASTDFKVSFSVFRWPWILCGWHRRKLRKQGGKWGPAMHPLLHSYCWYVLFVWGLKVNPQYFVISTLVHLLMVICIFMFCFISMRDAYLHIIFGMHLSHKLKITCSMCLMVWWLWLLMQFKTPYISPMWPALWLGGQSSWLLTMRSWVRFPALPYAFFLERGRCPWWPWSG